MADRPEVATTGVVGTTRAVGSIATRLGLTIGTLPLRRPWRGPSNPLTNLAQESTREIIHSFLVGALHLPTPELRSVEKVLDDPPPVDLSPVLEQDERTLQGWRDLLAGAERYSDARGPEERDEGETPHRRFIARC